MADVFVGCKLPLGVIIAVRDQRYVLNGSNSSNVIGGYGITPVPQEVWEEWSKLNGQSDLIKNNLIFAQTTPNKVEGEAREKAGIKSGYEPMPKKDSSLETSPEIRK